MTILIHFRHKAVQVSALQLQLCEQVHAEQPHEVPHERVPVQVCRLHLRHQVLPLTEAALAQVRPQAGHGVEQ